MDAKDVLVSSPLDVWARMPLAEAALARWRHVFAEQRLRGLRGRYRGRCYEEVLTFPTMTRLVADALLQYGGSGRRSSEKGRAAGGLAGSVAAAFGKLGRPPLELSQGLPRDGTAAVREFFPPGALRPLPASLAAFEVLLRDGTAIKRVAQRLRPLRGVGGGLLGGKALVGLQWRTGLALAVRAHPDGDAGEKPLAEGVVTPTAALVAEPRLFVGDRAYCDLGQAAHFTARPGDHSLVRYRSGTTFTPDAGGGEGRGADGASRAVVESWGWRGREAHAGRRRVRQLRLPRPGEGEGLILVTDLPDAAASPAAGLPEMDRERGGIGRVFRKVTEVFGLERLIGGTPEACLFRFAFRLLSYNLIQLRTGYVAQARGCEVEALSKEKPFDDGRRELIARGVVVTPEQTRDRFAAPRPAAQVRARLRELAGRAWSEAWRKAPRREGRRPPRHQGKRGHAGVYRLLRGSADPRPKSRAGGKRC